MSMNIHHHLQFCFYLFSWFTYTIADYIISRYYLQNTCSKSSKLKILNKYLSISELSLLLSKEPRHCAYTQIIPKFTKVHSAVDTWRTIFYTLFSSLKPIFGRIPHANKSPRLSTATITISKRVPYEISWAAIAVATVKPINIDVGFLFPSLFSVSFASAASGWIPIFSSTARKANEYARLTVPR